MKKNILHIATSNKFTPGLIKFVNENLNSDMHTFVTVGEDDCQFSDNDNVHNFRSLKKISNLIVLVKNIFSHDKLIVHGLFSINIIIFLGMISILKNKIYWVIFGGDLYCHKIENDGLSYSVKEFFRRFLISRLDGVITYIDGDVENARKWYGFRGKSYNCIMYQSNVFKGGLLEEKVNDNVVLDKKLTILVGNSADVTNNHLDVFGMLSKLDVLDKVEKIYCPLSYGDTLYAEKIKKKGLELFGDKFKPLMSFIPIDSYLDILSSIDIAIFAHNRQQAMGNTINLLGRGKKVYMNSNSTGFKYLESIGVKVYPLSSLSLDKIDIGIAISNNYNIQKYFCEEALIRQLRNLEEI